MRYFLVSAFAIIGVLLSALPVLPLVDAYALLGRKSNVFTNAHRFARGLPPLPPVRRTKTSSGLRPRQSPQLPTCANGSYKLFVSLSGNFYNYIGKKFPDPNTFPGALGVSSSDQDPVNVFVEDSGIGYFRISTTNFAESSNPYVGATSYQADSQISDNKFTVAAAVGTGGSTSFPPNTSISTSCPTNYGTESYIWTLNGDSLTMNWVQPSTTTPLPLKSFMTSGDPQGGYALIFGQDGAAISKGLGLQPWHVAEVGLKLEC